MADEKPKTTVYPLPFEAPGPIGPPVLWVAIIADAEGRTYLNAPLGSQPEAALALIGQAVHLINEAVAQRLRTALLAERVMQAPEDEPALTQGTA